jgi:hypothetical protein
MKIRVSWTVEQTFERTFTVREFAGLISDTCARSALTRFARAVSLGRAALCCTPEDQIPSLSLPRQDFSRLARYERDSATVTAGTTRSLPFASYLIEDGDGYVTDVHAGIADHQARRTSLQIVVNRG